jgi:hypothetical protein
MACPLTDMLSDILEQLSDNMLGRKPDLIQTGGGPHAPNIGIVWNHGTSELSDADSRRFG